MGIVKENWIGYQYFLIANQMLLLTISLSYVKNKIFFLICSI